MVMVAFMMQVRGEPDPRIEYRLKLTKEVSLLECRCATYAMCGVA